MMHSQTDSSIQLELPELIRMNRLVRDTIDVAGFLAWYNFLSIHEQIALLYHLHLYAQQAGYDESLYEQALQAAQLTADHPLVNHLHTFQGGICVELGLEWDWFSQRTAGERRLLLPFLVFLFGYAEGKVYANETEACCNHWWHRDLLDERVVQDLLRDPVYYRTSMKDDRAVKNGEPEKRTL